jgi:hypothetical protein
MGKNSSRTLLGILLALTVGACGSQAEPPKPGDTRGGVPDLRGRSVLVYPVQLLTAVPSGTSVDAELAHAFRTRGPGIAWVFPSQAEEALRRSPGLRARTRGLPVRVFLQAEVQRIGDPLFGEVARLATLTGADVALIPVELAYGEEGFYRLSAALIRVETGHVLWFGMLQGTEGAPESPAALASVAETLARALLPMG